MTRRVPSTISVILGVFLLLSALLPSVVQAEEPRDQELDPQRYGTNAERGLIFTKLAPGTSGLCDGLLRVVDTDLCTHGPDLPPDGFDVASGVAAAVAADATVSAAAVQCEGDGSSGKRVEVLYVRASDKTDRYASYLASFQQWATDADTIFKESAAETGGTRHIRYVHDANCVPIVRNVVVASTADDNFSATVTAVSAQGYNRTDRKYMMFVDANVYCGIGGIRGDDSAGSSNTNNGGPSYGRTDAGCWSGNVAAHELMHNLGGVQLSAPHTTGGYHCRDEWDLLCYSDSPNYPSMITVCSATSHDSRFDCNHDDYFHTNPPAGSYLATHWNAANSLFLMTGGGGTPTPTCPDAATEGDDTRTQARSVAAPSDTARAFCTSADEDWFTFQGTSGMTYRIDTYQLGGGVDTYLRVYASNGTTLLGEDDDSNGNLASIVSITAAATGAVYVQATNLAPDDDVANSYRLRVAVVDSAPPTVTWTAPVANGGTYNVTQTSGSVSLAVTAQDASGITSVQFQRWNASANAFTTFSTDASSPYAGSVTVASLAAGATEIVALVTDKSGNTAQASIFLNRGSNTPPVANAGADVTVDDTDGNGSQAVALNGSQSSDSDGTITAWSWKNGTQSLGTTASINPTLAVGQHTITLTVTDNAGATATDTVLVTVRQVGKSMSVTAMSFSASTYGSNYRLSGSVTVKANGAAVSGATVSLRITYPNGSTSTQTVTTTSSGVGSFTRTVSATGTYTLEVTNITKSAYTYAPASNVVSSATATAGSSGGGGGSTAMSVSAISLSRTTISGGYRLNSTVTVKAGSASVSSARVTIEITYPNGSKLTLSANTSSNGNATFSRNVTAKGTYTVRVTGVTKSGMTYDASKNTVTSRSITIQ